MAIVVTLGEAWHAGWQLTARCDENRLAWARKVQPCTWQRSLDMVTLVASRGMAFPLNLVSSRLRCPNCGGRKITVLFLVPGANARGIISSSDVADIFDRVQLNFETQTGAAAQADQEVLALARQICEAALVQLSAQGQTQ